MYLVALVYIFLLYAQLVHTTSSVNVDKNGYIAYCPCMGRFGNQAEHFLGALAFAKALNRTLVLPPWVYADHLSTTAGRPFRQLFLIDPLYAYHRVIPMDDFMRDLAPTIWPPERRIGFCYGTSERPDCVMKEGNPSTDFWNSFGIDFVSTIPFNLRGLHTNPLGPGDAMRWNKIYPPDDYPVLAFRGAPAAFPVRKEHEFLHKYLKWSSAVKQPAKEFIKNNLQNRPYLGIHLRNNIDWPNVCKDLSPRWHIFNSRQCLGENFEHSEMTKEICMQSKEAVLKQVRETLLRTNLRTLFVASEVDHMINDFKAELADLPDMLIASREPDDPFISLCILAKSTLYIGNCLSTFATFVRRERDVYGLPTEFWAMNYTTNPFAKSEL